MTKLELIESVRELNETASIEFLSQFGEEDLQEYLEHLMNVETECLTAAVSCSSGVPYN